MNAKQSGLLFDPFFKNNPIAIQILGICSALAVTTSMKNALTMCLAVTLVAIGSNIGVSVIRKIIPGSVRMIIEMVIIASMVIIVDQILKASSLTFGISKEISVYVSLIITNCIIMGRTEAFAIKNPVGESIIDALGNGIGYSIVLVAVAFFRELIGKGTLFEFPVINSIRYFSFGTEETWYTGNGLLILSPGAFFLIGIFIWILKSADPKLADADE